jgi:hypothetical protein
MRRVALFFSHFSVGGLDPTNITHMGVMISEIEGGRDCDGRWPLRVDDNMAALLEY